MKVVVTGGAGFIGSSLADSLQTQGVDVHVVDNFTTGQLAFLSNGKTTVHRADLTHEDTDLAAIFSGAACVYHLAANADVRYGWQDPFRDLSQNVDATVRVANACVAASVPELVFSSTGSVYGNAAVIPTPENLEFPIQTSLYGASKSAAEGFLAAFAENGSLRITVMRFVSVLGARYTHGHVLDFVTQLTDHPDFLEVLGNGEQKKSYMNVADCVSGLQVLRGDKPFEVFNLGSADYCSVRESISYILDELNLSPDIRFGDEERGWVGDNPFIFLDVEKAKRHGWTTTVSIQSSVVETVRWIVANPWVMALASSRSPQ